MPTALAINLLMYCHPADYNRHVHHVFSMTDPCHMCRHIIAPAVNSICDSAASLGVCLLKVWLVLHDLQASLL